MFSKCNNKLHWTIKDDWHSSFSLKCMHLAAQGQGTKEEGMHTFYTDELVSQK